MFPRSRPDPHGELKSEFPKGIADPIGRCGIEPARKRDSSVDVLEMAGSFPSLAISWAAGIGRNGLVDGVGRDVLFAKFRGRFTPARGFPGGNLDGTVPARARRVVGWVADSGGGTKSGKPS